MRKETDARDDDLGIISFPFDRLERTELTPGIRIDDMISRTDVDTVLERIKDAITTYQSQFLYGIRDHTKLHGSSIIQGLLERIDQAVKKGEEIDLLGASVIVLDPSGPTKSLTSNKRSTFTLHDVVRIGIAVEHAIQFLNEDKITVTTFSEYVFYVASIDSRGTNRTTHAIKLMENHRNMKDVVQAIKDARPTGRTLSPAELDELKWRRDRSKEERLERLRRERNVRFIKFPLDWTKREKALSERNKYHIDHPAVGGLPSLGKRS